MGFLAFEMDNLHGTILRLKNDQKPIPPAPNPTQGEKILNCFLYWAHYQVIYNLWNPNEGHTTMLQKKVEVFLRR